MTRNDLRTKIKNLVNKKYNKAEDVTSAEEVDLDAPSVVSLDSARFPVLIKFPTLKDITVKLLTDQYELFLKDIEWVAPKPTTFRFVLANDQVFYLTFTDRSWIGKVEGKKYYLLNLSEEESCLEAISRILTYGTRVEKPAEEKSKEEKSEPPKENPAPETAPAV